jgi:hypothetical protein
LEELQIFQPQRKLEMIFSIPETQKAIQDIEEAYKNILKGKPWKP